MPHTLLQESNAVRQQRGSRVEQRKVPIDYLYWYAMVALKEGQQQRCAYFVFFPMKRR